MALKDILVQLEPDERTPVRLAIAADLARRHAAFLTGVYVVDIPHADYVYGAGLSTAGLSTAGLPMAGLAPDQLGVALTAQARVAAAPVEAAFQETLHRFGVRGDWRLIEGHTPAVLSIEARYTDLVVVGQPNDPRRQDTRDRMAVEAVLMTSGRPMLTIPFAGDFPAMTDHILVAWNGGREASRAVHDALPLLRDASRVTILAVNPRGSLVEEDAGVTQANLAIHLGRHGVKAETARTVARDISDGDALLSYVSDIGASMLVAGGYGHSRARELIFGGVTRTLLAEMTVPVLFSH